ncbi:hypothetical protein [Granulicella arctica]|uniref:hypothetical protein n=1 Tax=Granulicella arctica TaxID=940613 RepID=UPI0021E0AC9C|nr:hypothetical protein [Granulicella arctica]
MTLPATTSPHASPRTIGGGYLFGVPLGDLGWFTTLLMSVASGFLAFFAATFLGIISILFADTVMHKGLDYANSYRLVGLPVGLLVLVVALIYLGSLWIKRILRKA